MPITPVKLRIGQTKTFRAVLMPGKAPDGTLLWSLVNPAIGNITVKPPLEARITALVAGATEVQVQYQDLCSLANASYPIETCNPVEDVEITNCPGVLRVGASHTMLYQLTPADGLCDDRIVWSTSNSNILTVDPTGVVTAVGLEDQEATITITTLDGNKKDYCTIKLILPIRPINEIIINQDQNYNFTSGTQCLAAITKNSRNVLLTLNDMGWGDSIQVLTRDGTLIAGRDPFERNHMTGDGSLPHVIPMTTANGFLSGASLKKTGPLILPPRSPLYNPVAPYNQATWTANGITANLGYSGCANDTDLPSGGVNDSSMEYFFIDRAPEHLLVFVTGNGVFNLKATWDEIKEYPYD